MSRDIERDVAGFRRRLNVIDTAHLVLEEEFDHYIRNHLGPRWWFILREDGSREYSVPGLPNFVVHGVFKKKPDCPEAIDPFLRASVQLDQETIVQSWAWRSDVFKNLKTPKETQKEDTEKGYLESLKILEHLHPGHALHIIASEPFLDWSLEKSFLKRVSDSGITYKLRNGRVVVIHCTYTGAAHSFNWAKGGVTSGPDWECAVFDDFSEQWDDDDRGYEELGKFLESLNNKEAAENLEVREDTKEMAEEAIYQGALSKLRDHARSGRILHTAMRREFMNRLLNDGVLRIVQSPTYKGAPVYSYPDVPYSEVAVHATYDGRTESPSLWVGGESAEYCKAFKESGWASIGKDWMYDKRSQSELGRFLAARNCETWAESDLVAPENKNSETTETEGPAAEAEKESDMNKNEFGDSVLAGLAGAVIDTAVTEAGKEIIKLHPGAAEFILSPLGKAVIMSSLFGTTEGLSRVSGVTPDSTAGKVAMTMSKVFVSEGTRQATIGIAGPVTMAARWCFRALGATLPKLRVVDTSSMMSDEDSDESTMKGTV